jgi:predicted AAA+ superfamily ATPase
MAVPQTVAEQAIADPAACGRLVEQVVTAHLASRLSPLMFWRDRGEIDLIGFPRTGKQVLVEVKYQTRVASSDRRALLAAGGGVLVTKNALGWDKESGVAEVPAHLFLLSLPEA